MTAEVIEARDAEISLLGAAMSGAPDLDALFDIVEPADFYHPWHGDVWAAIAAVHHAGNQPDPISVRLALAAASADPDPTRLFTLTTLTPVIGAAPFYAEQVADTAGKRRLVEGSIRVKAIAERPVPLDEAREMARQAIDEATSGRNLSRARTLADVMPAVIDQAQFGHAAILGTGWPDLDRTIGGLSPGRLVMFGARPGVGKSLAGTNLALHFAHHHKHAVLICSLEMPEIEVGQRLLAAHAEANLTGIQSGHTDERTWLRIASKQAELDALPITIDDSPEQTIQSIRRRARDIQRTRDDLALIVVDYLQLVKHQDPRRNRAEQISDIARGLKIVARESGACVVAMVQVNRAGAQHQEGGPRLTDIREGGAENDADQVILMHQPDDEIPEIELNVEKNRHGPRGSSRLQVQGHYARLAAVWRPGA